MFQLFIILLAVCFVFNFQIIVGGVQRAASQWLRLYSVQRVLQPLRQDYQPLHEADT